MGGGRGGGGGGAGWEKGRTTAAWRKATPLSVKGGVLEGA